MHAIRGRGNNAPVGLTIVIAEDNLLLREREFLRRGGTDVLVAVSAHDALHEAVRARFRCRPHRHPNATSLDGEGALRTISPRCGDVVLRQHASAKFRAALLDGGSARAPTPQGPHRSTTLRAQSWRRQGSDTGASGTGHDSSMAQRWTLRSRVQRRHAARCACPPTLRRRTPSAPNSPVAAETDGREPARCACISLRWSERVQAWYRVGHRSTRCRRYPRM